MVDLPPTMPPGLEVESPPQEAKPLSARPSKEKEKESKTPEGEDDEENKKRYNLVAFSNVFITKHGILEC